MNIPDLSLENAAVAVSSLGAVNWGLSTTTFDYNVVTEVLGSGNAEAAYLAIGVAGAAVLAEQFDVADIFEDS